MSGRLAGKVAIVTGGTSGIGRRIVERFVAEGAAVVFSGRRLAEGGAVASATGATFVQADVALEEDAERTIKFAIDAHGRLDVLVNNAGGPAPVGRLESLPLAGFDAAMAVHVRGTLAHIKHAAPTMRAQGAGSIVNLGSVAGHRAGYSSSVLYGVAKAAVIHLTRCAAMELGEDGVRRELDLARRYRNRHLRQEPGHGCGRGRRYRREGQVGPGQAPGDPTRRPARRHRRCSDLPRQRRGWLRQRRGHGDRRRPIWGRRSSHGRLGRASSTEAVERFMPMRDLPPGARLARAPDAGGEPAAGHETVVDPVSASGSAAGRARCNRHGWLVGIAGRLEQSGAARGRVDSRVPIVAPAVLVAADIGRVRRS